MGAWKALRKIRRRPTPHPSCSPGSASREELQRENERLRRKVEELERKVAEQDQQISDAEKQISGAKKQIADLERQLAGRKKDSTNSSKPPSSDGLAAARREKPARCRGRRKPGGQKGHPGCHRELEPPERVDQVVPVLPSDCRHWGQSLPQQIEQARTVGEVHRYQVSELPPLRSQIIEYQCHKVACPHCGQATRAELPAELPALSGAGVQYPSRAAHAGSHLGADRQVGGSREIV